MIHLLIHENIFRIVKEQKFINGKQDNKDLLNSKKYLMNFIMLYQTKIDQNFKVLKSIF